MTLFVIVFSVPTVAMAADSDGDLATLAPRLKSGFEIPLPLGPDDVERYRSIFDLQEQGRWKKADKLIGELNDPILLGHVKAQRFLHPTKYRSRYKELKAWMQDYADLPDATRLYKLALRRRPANWKYPNKPDIGHVSAGGRQTVQILRKPAAKKLSRANRQKRYGYKRKIKWYLRKGWTKAVKNLIATKEVKRLFSNFEMDEAKARLGAGYFAAGRDEWAVKWAGEAAKRSGPFLPEAHWTVGLASWRLGNKQLAAQHFEKAAQSRGTSEWMISANAFWAARAYLVNGQPARVNKLLGRAAAYPRTFYGMLARRILGIPSTFRWETPPLEKVALKKLTGTKGGKRALALLQVGEEHRAERDLRGLARRSSPAVQRGILALASHIGMPELAVRLNALLYPGGGGLDGAAFPLPNWQPEGGYKVDRATHEDNLRKLAEGRS